MESTLICSMRKIAERDYSSKKFACAYCSLMGRPLTRQHVVQLLIICGSVLLMSCDSTTQKPTHSAWPSADTLFRNSPSFLGGDSAYSADLGNGRVLWQFGDSFVGVAGDTRSDSAMVRNAVAIQSGYNPESASLMFYSGQMDGISTAFLSRPEPNWLWPGPAVAAASKLLLTYVELQPTNSNLGFEAIDGTAFLVDNPQLPPDQWDLVELDIPILPSGVRFGTGALLLGDSHVYAYFAVEPGDHDVYLARWSVIQVEAGNLLSIEYYHPSYGWNNDPGLAHPIAEQVQTEFSVHLDAITKQYIMVSVDGFGGTNIVKRTADRPEGPWTNATFVSRPIESNRGSGTLVYSAKAHPHLSGGQLIITYCTNDLNFANLLTDMSLYFPRFQRVQ